MDLDRIFIFCNSGINASMRDLGDKILYMYADISLSAEWDTNLIRKMESDEMEQKDLMGEKKDW